MTVGTAELGICARAAEPIRLKRMDQARRTGEVFGFTGLVVFGGLLRIRKFCLCGIQESRKRKYGFTEDTEPFDRLRP